MKTTRFRLNINDHVFVSPVEVDDARVRAVACSARLGRSYIPPAGPGERKPIRCQLWKLMTLSREVAPPFDTTIELELTTSNLPALRAAVAELENAMSEAIK